VKLAYCLIASATVHAALFTIPSFAPEKLQETTIPVPIVVVENAGTDGDGESSQGAKQAGKARDARGKLGKLSPAPTRAENSASPTPAAPRPAAEAAFDIPPAAWTEEAGSLTYASRPGSGGYSGASGAEGSGSGSGSGTGIGTGSGTGGGNATSPLVAAQAGYLDNPIPEYPERARRQGWQGTVLLNVLVSAEGKPQKVEITDSSGFEILDHAARAAVMRWRFHPARYGETPLESWVRVPIVFRLRDEKK
jgi:periplasmic protein TonB